MIKFELVTLAGTKFSKEVYEVVLPTADGYIAIFPSHMPLVSIATPGVISVRHKLGDPEEKLEYFATNGGVNAFNHCGDLWNSGSSPFAACSL